MAGYFELTKSSDGQFRFTLKGDNGETVLTSELYKTKASAENGIASVKSNAGNEGKHPFKIPARLASAWADYSVPFAAMRTISDRADDTAHVDFPRFLREVASRYSGAIIDALLTQL